MITTRQAAERYSILGEHKVQLPVSKMFLLGLVAGFFIAMAGIGASAAALSASTPELAKLITACVFPVGLAMVVINGSELFTGNNLMIISVLDKRIKVRQMLKNWLVVYIGSFVGSLMVVEMCAYTQVYEMFNNELAKNVINMAVEKCNISFPDAIVKGIL